MGNRMKISEQKIREIIREEYEAVEAEGYEQYHDKKPSNPEPGDVWKTRFRGKYMALSPKHGLKIKFDDLSDAVEFAKTGYDPKKGWNVDKIYDEEEFTI